MYGGPTVVIKHTHRGIRALFSAVTRLKKCYFFVFKYIHSNQTRNQSQWLSSKAILQGETISIIVRDDKIRVRLPPLNYRVQHVKKPTTSSFFNRITLYSAVGCRTLQEIKL